MSISAAEALDLAIRLASNQSELARRIKIRPSQISKWRRLGFVPVRRVPAVAKAVDLPLHVIRPDLPDMFPPPRKEVQAA
jgi:DNA-binding transcriptional regulator YdaS (Cro superfamily)